MMITLFRYIQFTTIILTTTLFLSGCGTTHVINSNPSQARVYCGYKSYNDFRLCGETPFIKPGTPKNTYYLEMYGYKSSDIFMLPAAGTESSKKHIDLIEDPSVKASLINSDNNMQESANNINKTEKTSRQSRQTNMMGDISSWVFPANQIANPSSIAVIIGNRNYLKGVPDVEFAHNDADLMKRYVIELLGYREGNVIDIRDATQADFISVFGNAKSHKGKLFNWLRPGESDVFVYYSGHGAPGMSDGQGYLLPVNGDPNTVELNGYPLETLYNNLSKLPTKSLTVALDACFSGSSQAGSVVKNASSISLKLVNTETTIPKATILTATDLSEVASWDDEAQLGLFTRYFLAGVTGQADQDGFGNGDGQVTLGELKKYLKSEVTYMARRLYSRDQHPQVSGNDEKLLAITN